MELRNITTFMRAAELQSFSSAAEQLGYSQSAVSIQIKQLEQELGVPLFERIGKQIRLTEDGTRFLSRALDILNAVSAAKNMAHTHEEITGTLRIGTAESLLISILPPIIMEFSKLCPHVKVSIHTGIINELFDMVQHNDVDLLFFLDKKTYHPEWIKITEKLEPIVFAASTNHPLARQKNIPIQQVLSQPLLLTEKGISYRYDLEQLLAAEGLELRPFLETGNTNVITDMLLRDAGVSFLPEYVIHEHTKEGRLSVLDVSFPPVQMYTQLVYHKNKWVTPQMELFLDLLTKSQRQ